MSRKPDYSFVKLVEKEYHPDSKLVKALQKDLPTSVHVSMKYPVYQMVALHPPCKFLNIIQIAVQKYHSPTNIKNIELWSYENFTDKNRSKDHESNWDDPTRLIFLVGFIKTRYKSSNLLENEIKNTIIYNRNDPTPQMMSEFSKFFDWSSNRLMFGTVNARFVPFLEALCVSQGGSVQSYPDLAMYLPKEKWSSVLSKRSNVPGVKVQKLREDHAKIVNRVWQFGDKKEDPNGVLLLIQDSIKHYISAGVYLTKPDSETTEDNEELTSWMISLPFGTLNALHTPELYRRKGYAEMVLLEASARAVENAIFPLCEIELESTASKALFDKVGFELAFDASWIFYNKGSTESETRD